MAAPSASRSPTAANSPPMRSSRRRAARRRRDGRRQGGRSDHEGQARKGDLVVGASLFPSPGLFAAFLAASVLLAFTPGPDMALILSRTFAGGRSRGFAALGGAISGVVVHTFAAALGLSALIAASARAYEAVKIAGALYLLYLAWSALRSGAALKLEARGGASGDLARQLPRRPADQPHQSEDHLVFRHLPAAVHRRRRPDPSRKLFVLGFASSSSPASSMRRSSPWRDGSSMR